MNQSLNNLPISTTAATNAVKQHEQDYCCMHCDAEYPLDQFIEIECDGDIWGTCPNCSNPVMITQFDDDEGLTK